MPKPFQISLAPQQLWQAINPWTFTQQQPQFGLINIDLGLTPQPETEQEVLQNAGSYGRQLGRIGDALEVLIKHALSGADLTQEERDTLDALQCQLADVRRAKRRKI